MLKVLRFVSRLGVSRGFLGNSRTWTVLGAVAISIRAMKRLLGGTPQVVYSHRLRPGDCLVVAQERDARVVRAPS